MTLTRRLMWLMVLIAAAVLAYWLSPRQGSITIASGSTIAAIKPPPGYRYLRGAQGSFAEWLLHLPLKPGRPPIRLYDGSVKFNQSAHFAVLDVDVGNEDLQQCADAIIRLRAEYLYHRGWANSIHFDFTSGQRASFSQWAKGYRPIVEGQRVSWVKSAARDSSYRSFRAYLRTVFMYAGTMSLAKELLAVPDPRNVRSGDVLIQPGSPGHAEMVVAVAANQRGKKVFLLAQGYMPAQDIHIPKNPTDLGLSPWYEMPAGDQLITPGRTFTKRDLKRFAE
jgi:hypothetical protein